MLGLRRHVPDLVVDWCAETPDSRSLTLPATLLFADVAGFTALTEKLAYRGRRGAEELVDELSRVFGGILEAAALRQGDLLKFGGDSLLFLFHGDEHVLRACDTAVELRRQLVRAARTETGSRRLRLSMSVGVHSGDVHLFLVGTPHRELILAGSAASTVVRLGSLANAGEILLSAETAARLPAESVRTRADGELLLRWMRPRTPARSASALRPLEGDLLRSLVPNPLCTELALGSPEAAHCIATVGFIKFSGTDTLADNGAITATVTVLDETLTAIVGACIAESVTVLATDVDVDGAKVVVVSGVPFASEDDEGRMLRTLRRVATSTLPLPVKLAANRGHVFVAEIGNPRRAVFSAMGDTTNTAARLMDKAPPGVVYAHPSVLEASRTLFAASPAGPFSLKGKVEAVPVHEVGDEIGPRPADNAGSPLLGRDVEVARLRTVLTDLQAGRGRTVVVTGTAGIGKSRLVREAFARPGDVSLLQLRAEPDSARTPYRVLRDQIRALLGIDRGATSAMAARLLESVARVDITLLPLVPLIGDVANIESPSTDEVDALEPEFRPDRTADALLRLLDAAVRRPLVVVVDDAQWCDAATAYVLVRLRKVAIDTTSLVVLRRPGTDGLIPEHAEALHLGQLDDSIVERIVLARSEATPLRRHDVLAIVDRADGSPLVAEQLTYAARDLGGADAVPDSIRAILATQVDRLAPHVRRVIRRCSVLGRSFRPDVLKSMLLEDGLALDALTLDGLGTLLDCGDDHGWRFCNAMTRDVIYDSLAFSERVRLHRSAGRAMEQLASEPLAEVEGLAFHFARAGDASRTWHYARLAAERARRAYSNAEAASQYELALDASRRLPDVAAADIAEVWTRLGEVRELAGMFEASLDAFRQASRLAAHDPIVQAGLMLKRARARERAGSFSSALREVTLAGRGLDGLTGPETARMRARLLAFGAVVRWGQERPLDALRRAGDAVASARDADEPAALAQALMIETLATLALGRAAEPSKLAEALEIFVALGDLPREAQARGNLGFLAAHSGRWDEAVKWLTSCRAVYTQVGDEVGAAIVALNLGEMLTNQGQLDRAQQELEHAARVAAASGFAEGAAHGQMQLARIRLARGDVVGAAELADRARQVFMDRRQTSSALQAAVVRASAYIAAGEPTAALDLLDVAEAATGRDVVSLVPRVAAGRAQALLALGRTGDAAGVIAKGLDAAFRLNMPYEEALLRWLSANLPDRTLAEREEAQRLATGIFVRLGVAPPGVDAVTSRQPLGRGDDRIVVLDALHARSSETAEHR